jgi:hypothetical protein
MGRFLMEENAMSSRHRRRDRRAAGRTPAILRLESLEHRRLLTGGAEQTASTAAELLVETQQTEPSDPVGAVTPDVAVSTSATTVAAEGGETPVDDAEAPPPAAGAPPVNILPVASLPEAAAAPAAALPTATAPPVTAPTPAPSTAKPDLVPLRIEVPTNLDWDQPFVIHGTIKNQGTVPVGASFKVEVLASETPKGGAEAVPVGSFVVPQGLAAGASHEFEVEMRTPGRPPERLTANPSYYLTLVTDAANTVLESNEKNNGNQGLQGVDAAVVTITPRLPSKLVAAGLQVAPRLHAWGGSMEVTATIHNEGPGKAPPTNARIVVAPIGEDPLGPSGYTIGSVPMPEIPPLQMVSSTQEVRLPTYPPRALANASQLTVLMISDADGMADPVIKPISTPANGLDWTTAQITPKPTPVQPHELPDLAVSALATPTAIAWDQTIELKAKIENRGAHASGPFRVRFALVPSRDPSAAALVLTDVEISALGASQSQEIVESVKLPARIPAGLDASSPQGLVLVMIDPERRLDEARTDNNRLSSTPLSLRLVSPDGSTTAPATTTTTPTTPASSTPPATTSTAGAGQDTTSPTKPAGRRKPGARIAQLAQRLAKATPAQAGNRIPRRQRVVAHEGHREAVPKLRIFPRNRQIPRVPERLGKVHILPLRHATNSDTLPNQPA